MRPSLIQREEEPNTLSLSVVWIPKPNICKPFFKNQGSKSYYQIDESHHHFQVIFEL
jgi:hypothetical protein